MRQILCLLILSVSLSSVASQFETLVNENASPAAVVPAEATPPPVVPEVPEVSDPSEARAIQDVAASQVGLVGQVSEMGTKLDNLTFGMSQRLDNLASDINQLSERFGMIGDVMDWVATNAVMAVIVAIIFFLLPLAVLLIQLLILCRLCCLSKSRYYGRYNGALELEEM